MCFATINLVGLRLLKSGSFVKFTKHYKNWTFRINIIGTNKLPSNWKKQHRFMAYCVAYNKAYDIPLPFLVKVIKWTYIWYLQQESVDGKIKFQMNSCTWHVGQKVVPMVVFSFVTLVHSQATIHYIYMHYNKNIATKQEK
jgi:hypothetical protein